MGEYVEVKYVNDDHSLKRGYILSNNIDPTWSYHEGDTIFELPNSYRKYLSKKSSGEQVLLLNMCLNRYYDEIFGISEGQLPYMRIPNTDTYSAKTRRAVEQFQLRNGLSADGLAGEKTLLTLQNWIIENNKTKGVSQ